MKVIRQLATGPKVYDYPRYEAVERLLAVLKRGEQVQRSGSYWLAESGARFKLRTVRKALVAGMVAVNEGVCVRVK